MCTPSSLRRLLFAIHIPFWVRFQRLKKKSPKLLGWFDSSHNNCLLISAVYPTLNQKLQEEWDEAEQARYEGLITEQVKIPLRTHNDGPQFTSSSQFSYLI